MEKVTPIDSPNRKTVAKKSKSSQLQSRERWERACEAYELRIGGKLPSEIAEILGVEDGNEVDRLISERYQYDASYLNNMDRQSILVLELTRLEALQAAVWPSAMMGDPKSIDSAIKIIATRAKISGLEQVDPVVQKNLVLVMGDKEEDYIAALKATRD